MHSLSLAPLTINDAGPLELIEAAAAGGFEAVTLRVLGAPGAAPVPPLAEDRPLVEAIRRKLAEEGVGIISATGVWVSPDFKVAEVEPAIAVAAELGAMWCLATGFDAHRTRLVDNFSSLCEMAERYGLGIALEFMPYIPIATIGQASRLIEEAGRANAALVIDALHLARSGGVPADVVGKRVAYCQLCDAPADKPEGLALREESLRHRLYPGEGALPLAALMAVLPADAMIDLEAPVAAEAGLSFVERGKRAGEAMRRFLSMLPK